MDVPASQSDPGSPWSDSGSQREDTPADSIPGVLEENEMFEFRGAYAFVTYTHSQVTDPQEFHRLLRASLEAHLPLVGQLKLFGSKELHEDGTPHYHVVLRFSPRVHWRGAREKFTVWLDKDGDRVPDTRSIFIRKKPEREPPASFLNSVQSYVVKEAKEPDTFGEWIEPITSAQAERVEMYRKIIKTPSRAEAKALFEQHFPRECLFNRGSVDAVLRGKVSEPVRVHEPKFVVSTWKARPQMSKWQKRNFPVRSGGRPTCLVIVGPSRCGKTEWAMSFGRPASMTGGWNVDELTRPDATHLVLNDIVLKDFPNKRDLAVCQESITATGKWREQKTLPFGLPVIWTCTRDNSLEKDKQFWAYMKESGATIVKIRKKEKLYIEQENDSV